MTTLYIPEPGALLKADQTNFHVFPTRSFSYQVAITKVEEIIIFGYTNISQEALKLVRSLNISLLFLEQEKPYYSSGQTAIKHQQKQLQCCQNSEFTWETTESLLRASCHNRSHLLKGLLGEASKRQQAVGNSKKESRQTLSSVEKFDAGVRGSLS
ncbi:MAG: CRISPR-associated endonuclease Cas1 [Spirulinaceae cyanobacterium]